MKEKFSKSIEILKKKKKEMPEMKIYVSQGSRWLWGDAQQLRALADLSENWGSSQHPLQLIAVYNSSPRQSTSSGLHGTMQLVHKHTSRKNTQAHKIKINLIKKKKTRSRKHYTQTEKFFFQRNQTKLNQAMFKNSRV